MSTANSIYGTVADDEVGMADVVALANGNYVVPSFQVDGAVVDAGAVTWGNGTTGTVGQVTAANSLVGTNVGDKVSYYFDNWVEGVTPLGDGNYVVLSSYWDGPVVDSGAVTWADGSTGLSGPVSTTTSFSGLATGSLMKMSLVYEPVHGSVVVGRPADNMVTWMLFPQEGPVPGVSVTKRVVGPKPWSFEIEISPVPYGQPAKQTVTNLAPTVSWTGLIAGITYTVSETPKTGWTAYSLVCSGATGDLEAADPEFTPGPQDQVTCQFENRDEMPPAGADTGGPTITAFALLVFGAMLLAAQRRRAPRYR